jgi:hypothetical protein
MNILTGPLSSALDGADKALDYSSLAFIEPAALVAAIVTVPDGGTTLILLGLAFTTIMLTNRYFRKRAKSRAALKRP